MYKRAREAEKNGEVVTDVPMRDMIVYEAEVLNVETIVVNYDSEKISDLETVLPIIDDMEKEEGSVDIGKDVNRVVVTVRFAVASGVYIRSLAEDLGKRLGYPATLQNLRRTKVGEFTIDDAQSISDFE
jgi:tRNA U55 pseudouridine synthase TruB